MALDSQAVAAARALARQVVNEGLAETEPVRQAYFAYVEAGCPGMFGDALVERGLVSVDALASLPDDGIDHHSANETGRFPRPSESGRFSAVAKKTRSSRLVPQSGLDLLADVDDDDAGDDAPPAIDPRVPAAFRDMKVDDEKGLSILSELEDEDIPSRPPARSRARGSTQAGVAKLKAPSRPAAPPPPKPESLPPLPAAAALPQVTAAAPQPEGLSLELSEAEPALDVAPGPPPQAPPSAPPQPPPSAPRQAPPSAPQAESSTPSFDDLALDLAAVKAKATRQVQRPQVAAPEAGLEPLTPIEARQDDEDPLTRSVDELSLDGDAAPAQAADDRLAQLEAAVASGRSLDELGFDLDGAAGEPPTIAQLEEAFASGRSFDELGFDPAVVKAVTESGEWSPPQVEAAPPDQASPWGAPSPAPDQASPWGAASPPPAAPAAAAPAPAPPPPPAEAPPADSSGDDPLAALEISEVSEDAFFAPVGEAPDPAAVAEGSEADLQVGQQLGDYELVSELGRGGMGIVFKALRKGSVHHYAIKVLKPGTGPVAQKRRRRFQREVEIMRQLDHNNLIRIYDCGRHELYDWYSMDYVEGTELAEMLAQYRLSPDEKLQVFEEICKAMAHAHERAVVHRDLKPANVLVGAELTVRVLDFGLAKIEREAEDNNLTQAGTALGTPYYMSPEQVLNPTDVGPEADVWSMGVMLYEMMTGRRPFVGQTAGEIANAILHHDPTPPSKINQFLHPDIEAICMRALDKDLGTRYATVEGMLADMQRHRRGKKVERKSSRGVGRWLEKNKVPFLVGAGVASAGWALIVAYLLIT